MGPFPVEDVFPIAVGFFIKTRGTDQAALVPYPQVRGFPSGFFPNASSFFHGQQISMVEKGEIILCQLIPFLLIDIFERAKMQEFQGETRFSFFLSNRFIPESGFRIRGSDIDHLTVAMITYDLYRCAVYLFPAGEKNGLKRQFLFPQQVLVGNLTSLFAFKEPYDFTAAEPFKFSIIEQDPCKSGSAFNQVVLFIEGKGLETHVTHRVFGVEQVPQAAFEHHQRFPVETVLDQPALEVSFEFDLVKAVAQHLLKEGTVD